MDRIDVLQKRRVADNICRESLGVVVVTLPKYGQHSHGVEALPAIRQHLFLAVLNVHLDLLVVVADYNQPVHSFDATLFL